MPVTIDTLPLTLLGLVSATCGFAARILWEKYAEKRKQIELELWKLRVGEIEKRLREFYWPIYLRLQRDNVVWEKILGRFRDDREERRLGHQIERDVLLPNHAQIVTIIEKGMHFVRGDEEIETALLEYLRHVDVYRSLRAAGIHDKDPIEFGEPYPRGFFDVINRKVKTLQQTYEQILSEKAAG